MATHGVVLDKYSHKKNKFLERLPNGEYVFNEKFYFDKGLKDFDKKSKPFKLGRETRIAKRKKLL